MADGEATANRMAVTCRTTAAPEKGILEDCPENGVTYVVRMYPNATPPIYNAVCGQCGFPILDIVPAESLSL
ncbi:hypothetical protein ACIBAC_00390 [Streptomyces sp. NPDC051362]|uniref:hypothetical protein n=1 Tax=Streptomyces sp. NPDC051362 TaxID=3365651 RepID=UPI0037A03413